MADKIQTPEGHIRRKQRGELGIFIKEFIRGKIGPMTRGRIAKRHREFLQCLCCGVKGSGIITVSSTNIIGVVDRKEDLELALIDKSMDDSLGRSGVDGQRYGEFGRSRHDEERNRIWKRAIKFSLKVEKLKRGKIRRAGVISRCKDSCHTWRQKGRGGNRDRKDSAEKKGSGLSWGEHRITVRTIIRKSVKAGFGAKETKIISEKGIQISFT